MFLNMKKFTKVLAVLMAGLAISTTLIFTGCPTGNSTTTYTVTKGAITGSGDISADKQIAAAGDTVTLTIAPVTGWELQNVTVTAANGTDPTVDGSGDTRTFTMPASNVTFSGVFVELPPDTYAVTQGTITGQGTITANPTNAAAGATVTLTASPATGWELQSVTVTAASGTNPNVSGTGNTQTFTMPASNVTFNGIFVELPPDTYAVTQGTITGQGTITANPASAAVGATVTLTITPATGWELQSVTVTAATGTNPTVNGSGNTQTFTMPASNVTFGGVFTQKIENIAITLVDANALSEDITLTSAPNASQVTFTVSGNYHDYQWYLDGEKLNETSGSLTLYKIVVGTDPRHVIVIALDAGGTPYSGAVLFQFN